MGSEFHRHGPLFLMAVVDVLWRGIVLENSTEDCFALWIYLLCHYFIAYLLGISITYWANFLQMNMKMNFHELKLFR